MREIAEQNQHRNSTSIRWTDSQMKVVSDTARERRTNVSAMIRDMVIQALRRDGVRI